MGFSYFGKEETCRQRVLSRVASGMTTSRPLDTNWLDIHVGCSGASYPTICVPLGMEGFFDTGFAISP